MKAEAGSHLTQKELLRITDSDLAALRRQVNIALKTTVDEGWTSRANDPSRVTRLRLSGLPFCGLRWFLGLVGSTSNYSHSQFSSSYFTSVGSTIHAVLQESLMNVVGGRSVEVIHDWKCLDCGCITPMSKKPNVCVHCGKRSETSSMEVTLEHGLLLGHVDEILEIGIQFEGKLRKVWIVLDYKTTSMRKIGQIENNVSHGYREQISSYVSLLRHMGKPAVFGVLVYLPRDNPFKYKSVFIKVHQTKTLGRVRTYLDRFRLASTAREDKQVWEIVKSRPCKRDMQPEFGDCKWGSICSGKENSKRIYFEATSIRDRIMSRLPILKPEILEQHDKEL